MVLDLTTIGTDNASNLFDVNAECSGIHNINSSLQCLYALTSIDCTEKIEYIDYNYFAFCYFGLKLLVPATTILVLWLAMLFISLGITSNYFLCPALFAISNHLGLSQNVAGVTLLAFGNGSPDIFSSVAGFHKASAELAISSLVGAGMFVTCVVAGSVFMTQSFSLMIRPFLRDIAFYILAISWTFALFFTNKSYLYHGIGFVVLYLVYIIVVLGSRFIYVSIQKKKENSVKEKNVEKTGKKKDIVPDRSEIPKVTVTVEGITYDNDPEATAVVLKALYFNGFEWVDGGRRLSKAHIPLDERRKSSISRFSIDNHAFNNTGSCQSLESNGVSSTERLAALPNVIDKGEFWEFLLKICPVNTEKWSSLPWWRKLLVVIKIPPIFVMRLTIPVLDTGADDMNWNRLLTCVQCVTGPVFITLISEYEFYMIRDVFPVIVLVLCICIGCALLVYFTSERDFPPNYHWIFAYSGFIVAVMWTYCLANEIVAVLQVIGVIFDLSDSILGLTILAWGNSISDFLSNVAVARKNFPRMAISACYGGPLLALLLGLGIPCIIEIIKGRIPPKNPLKFSPQFFFLFCAIGIGLFTTAITMTLWKFQTKRLYSIVLITLYLTFMTLSVLEELKIFTFSL
ncbi:mitochondrial sodium/calcium exchanger protein isoform X2 [Parasteatoda tepidariorum]|uniref:mitochondrial sodium/calcium exchanger protein isoform X2 n=1 Tax=Parasteatoda tepidariorum TaxID=114398 RepID=UPI00077FC180|nr:mitochondrial sodium/calcium exchanger protein isoform X2 [Parasteatoda tepidariorum]